MRLLAATSLACLLWSPLPASADILHGRVVGVTDGDTITVLDAQHEQHKVRLNGIDAPESGQAFGQVSKRNLSELVFGKDVDVDWKKVDRYGRLVGLVRVGKLDANLEQIRAGLAWFYRQYAADVASENRPRYDDAETEARAAKRGFWRDPSPIEPWAYRAAPKSPATGTAPPSSASTAARPLGLLGAVAQSVEIRGNRNSKIYHVPGCRNYDDIAMRNRVIFKTEAEAVAAGYRKARNCN